MHAAEVLSGGVHHGRHQVAGDAEQLERPVAVLQGERVKQAWGGRSTCTIARVDERSFNRLPVADAQAISVR